MTINIMSKPHFPLLPGPPVPLICELNSRNSELQRISNRLMGFDYENSIPWMVFTLKLGPHPTHADLLDVARSVSRELGFRLDRDAKRRKIVLIKWFDEHWATIAPYIDYYLVRTSIKQKRINS